MAQQHQKMQIDLSGRGGLADKFYGDMNDSSGSPQLRYVADSGQMVQGLFNAGRKYGYLAPVPSTFTTISETDVTYNFANEIRAFIFDSVNSQFFAGENGNQMWGRGTGNLTSWVSAATALTGTAVHITDYEFYQLNGSRKLFGSYMKAGGGDIFAATVDTGAGGTFTSITTNWFSASASGGGNTGATSDVFMVTCDNNLMYICDGYIVYQLDGTTSGGTNGTVTTVLTFPVHFYLVDGVDYRGNLALALQAGPSFGANSTVAAETNVAGVYFWDRSTSGSSNKDFIPMAGVREIRKLYKTPDGYLRAIVISSQDKVEIRHFTGSTFVTLKELSANAYPTYRDSVSQMGPFTVWLGNDGYIYAHGNVAPSTATYRSSFNQGEGLFIIGDTTGLLGASPSMGALLNLDNSANRVGLMWSGKSNGGTIYNRYLYPYATGAVPAAGNVYTPVKFLPKLAAVNFIDVFCAPTANTGTTTIATIDVYINQSTTSSKTFTVTKDLANRGYVTIPLGIGYVNSIQLKIAWDTGTTIGTDDFLPSFASVDYTPEENFG